jgi:L-galactose dehydrogenase
MQYRQLGQTGMRVSAIGFGASPFGNVFGETDDSEVIRAVHYAVDRGINFFDVSPYYGRTLAEERLGRALQGKRQQVYLATKCGRYDTSAFDFSARRIHASIDECLNRLRTDYVDLLQAHDIEFGDARQITNETIPAMREAQAQGKARFVGITSYQLKLMAGIAELMPVDTVLSYCRYNLLIDDMDSLLTPTLKRKSIGLINASPLHMGILSPDGPPSWHPAPADVITAGRKVVRLVQEWGYAVPEVALRFCLDHPYVATTLVGMRSAKQVEENLRALDLVLDSVLLKEIACVVEPVKNKLWQSGLPANWDYKGESV